MNSQNYSNKLSVPGTTRSIRTYVILYSVHIIAVLVVCVLAVALYYKLSQNYLFQNYKVYTALVFMFHIPLLLVNFNAALLLYLVNLAVYMVLSQFEPRNRGVQIAIVVLSLILGLQSLVAPMARNYAYRFVLAPCKVFAANNVAVYALCLLKYHIFDDSDERRRVGACKCLFFLPHVILAFCAVGQSDIALLVVDLLYVALSHEAQQEDADYNAFVLGVATVEVVALLAAFFSQLGSFR